LPGDEPPLSLWERVKYTLVRPDDDPADRARPTDDRTAEELREAIRRSDDKERTIGVVAAPIAAIVGIAISSASINYAKTHHENVHVYDELTYVLLGLAVLIMVSSLLRKRLFQGITLALFGLAVFQLHYTYAGFALPFVLAGAWYLVRAYRLQQSLKRAEADDGVRPTRSKAQAGPVPRPRPNKRYTPPT
jgi:Ca2+/Na+ antiporter